MSKYLVLAAWVVSCSSGHEPCGGGTCEPITCEACTHGTCVDATCVCDPGYVGASCGACADGYHASDDACVVDVADACEPNPCSGDHPRCVAHPVTGYRCDCPEGQRDVDGICEPACTGDADLCAAANASAANLVSANGFGAVAYDVGGKKLTSLFEHIYRAWDEGVVTRDLLFDTYLGVRSGATHTWLDQVAPARIGYLDDSGIIWLVHHVGRLRIDTYAFAPWGLARPALVLIGKMTNEGAQDVTASLYTLHNYHLGYTSAADKQNPDAVGERAEYRAADRAYVETGVGGMLWHAALGAPTRHGVTPNNPWAALNDGHGLTDTDDSGIGDDRVVGLEKELTLAPGDSGWFGAVSAFSQTLDETGLGGDVAAYFGDKDAEQVLSEARQAWEDWRVTPPAGLSLAERSVWRQSEAVLRQGQVLETTDKSHGQIVASLPPSQWNITWVRDMSYATVALSRMGHASEARAALDFVLDAEPGEYESYVGAPYRVSVTRYFGRGAEESDANADGPNIEFDGFGLFAWALGEHASSLDATRWGVFEHEVVEPLLGLVEANGLVAADSSIWEVHWNGHQKQFAFTSLAAARGLCAAADLAEARGETTLANTWRDAGVSLRDAVASHLTSDHALAGSFEELTGHTGTLDAATLEAFNWNLFSADGAVATATLTAVEGLRVASGRGVKRNDDGGWYDSQEWGFADLRLANAHRANGNATQARRLLDWITAQALANYGMVAELHDPSTSAYLGAVPMVGYGAGAYVLTLLDRDAPVTAPACGVWEDAP